METGSGFRERKIKKIKIRSGFYISKLIDDARPQSVHCQFCFVLNFFCSVSDKFPFHPIPVVIKTMRAEEDFHDPSDGFG